MHNLPSSNRLSKCFCWFFKSAIGLVWQALCLGAAAQDCPPNIDFERGTFDGWTCYTGYTAAVSGQNQINLSPSGPSPDRHTMIQANSGLLDEYGGFPINCPNGSGYSIKLGNNRGGGEAEGISYEFTIPANKNEYSLIYHYAVVFEDPQHEIFQQPRMVVDITNVSDNYTINCASFYFVPYGSILPGFFQSTLGGFEGTPVWCKDWSAVSINLDGLAGKTIRLFFKTADCTFRRHFGYAYIDVNSECSSEFTGASYCPDDTAVNVTAPYGYQSYQWFSGNFTRSLGNTQTIHFDPPPPAGTTIAVVVTPYNGYGCPDTLYAKLLDNLTITPFAGADALYCGNEPVPLGAIPKPGLVYNWSPATNLSNPSIANPFASPPADQQYILTVRNSGGGCRKEDTVLVRSSSLDATITLLGKAAYCLNSTDSAVLKVSNADSIQWYKNDQRINVHSNRFRVTQTGTYYAVLYSKLGCIVETERKQILVEEPLKGIRYPVKYAISATPQELDARALGGKTRWRPPMYLNDSTAAKPLFTGSEDQLYLVHLTTAGGCALVDTQLVKVVPRAEIFVPTAFTPNRDGLNDVLQPVLMGMKELKYFRVFNRWGQLLFETKKEYAGWNGLLQGTPQASDTFVWVAEAIGVDGRTYIRKGVSVLIR